MDELVSARTAVLEDTITPTVARLERDLGSDWNEWRWGCLHTVSFVHPFAQGSDLQFRILGWFFNLGPFEAPGGAFTVNAGWWRPPDPFRVWIAPMYRQIVDLGDLSRSRWALPPPGLAEQRLSAHYADAVEPWLAGRYRPMSWTRAQVDADAEATLTLVPAERR